MENNRTEFRPFGVDSRARPCRLAFLVDGIACPDELIGTLYDANYELWGGRFNPIVPVHKGEIEEKYWLLLKYVDPDVVYSYVSLTPNTIARIEREIVPWRIEAHAPHLTSLQPPHFHPSVTEGLVKSRQVLPLLMSQQRAFSFASTPTLLTYFHDWKGPINKQLERLVRRNFGLIHERSTPALPDEWRRLQIQNNSSPAELFQLLSHTSNVLFPYQASSALTTPLPRVSNGVEDYCILIGDSAQTWIYFWNRIFLADEYRRVGWNALCLSTELIEDDNFVGSLREFLKRRVHRSGSAPSSLSLQSFDCSEEELAQMKARILNGLDIIPRSKKLGEVPEIAATRLGTYIQWGYGTTHQQGTSTHSLLTPPRTQVPLDQGVWVMDVRIQYIPRFPFYANEALSWKLPRRGGVAEAFFGQRCCRIDADYSFSVEMRRYEPFILDIPSEENIFHRALGIIETKTHGIDLKVAWKKHKFRRLGVWDKGLYSNGILELFGGLQNAGRYFVHSYWRAMFEQLSLGRPEKEAGLLDRVRNTLEKKKKVIETQLTGGSSKAIDWLSRLVIRHARELQMRQEEISFKELESTFQEQRERFLLSNPGFRPCNSDVEIEADRESSSTDLRTTVQELTDLNILQQGIKVRCANCGSRFWRDVGSLKQKMQCDGCNATVPMPVESIWLYRLNSLVRNGIALHGCIPVISALHSLRERARDSFIYIHGVGLFKDESATTPEAEIDLLCISDGNLICGEVKSSASEFTQEELGKLARVASDIVADYAVISAFNDPDGLMPQHLKILIDLLPKGCSALICGPRPQAFEPQPYAR